VTIQNVKKRTRLQEYPEVDNAGHPNTTTTNELNILIDSRPTTNPKTKLKTNCTRSHDT